MGTACAEDERAYVTRVERVAFMQADGNVEFAYVAEAVAMSACGRSGSHRIVERSEAIIRHGEKVAPAFAGSLKIAGAEGASWESVRDEPPLVNDLRRAV